jgi:hypothetical protein
MKFHALLALLATSTFAAPSLLDRDGPPRGTSNGPYDLAGAVDGLGHEAGHIGGDIGKEIPMSFPPPTMRSITVIHLKWFGQVGYMC